MGGSKKFVGLVFVTALSAPIALAGVASANEAESRVLVSDGAVEATAACTGPAAISSVTYKVNGSVVSELTAGLPDGATVEVTFDLAAGCEDLQVGLAAYETSSATWDPSKAEDQELFAKDTGVFDAGTPGTLSVTVPECYFQVDFFTGPVLTKLTATDNYTSQGRLIDAGHGGQEVCVEGNETTTTTRPTTTSSTTEVPTTSTTTASTLPTEVLGEVVERPQVLGAELAETGLPTGSLVGLGAALTLAGSAMSGLAIRMRENGKHFRK